MDSWHDTLDIDDEDGESWDFQFGGKDAIIFLIDMSAAMHVKNSENGMASYEMALKCVHSTLKSKIFSSPSDVIGVLMYATANKVEVRDFDNMALVLPLMEPEGKSIMKLESLLDDPHLVSDMYGSTDKYAMHEALWQCQSLFNEVKGKVATKKVILVTNCADPHRHDPNLKRHAVKKAMDLAESGITLEVLPLIGENESFDWQLFYRDMLPGNNEVLEEASRRYEDLMRIVRKRIHKKRSTGKINLDLGNGIVMSVASYNLVQKASKPPKTRLARDTNEIVRSQRNYIHPETGAPLMPTEVELFQKYGNQKICFTQDETKAMLKMDMKPGFKLIGFKKLSEVRWTDYVRSGNFIYPDDFIIKGSRNLFAALLQRCIAREVVPFCSFKSRDRSAPSFVVLLPLKEAKDREDGAQITPPGFSVFYLPFADDIREIPHVPLLKPGDQELEVAKKIVKKLKLKNYSVEAFENPALQAHYRLLETIALEKEDVEEFQDYTLPPADKVQKKLSDLARQLSDSLGNKRRKADGSSDNGGAAKQFKAEDIENMVKAKEIHKLTVDRLKKYLTSVGASVTGRKKADLVGAVYSQFQ